MADLISQVRGLAYAGTADFTLGTVTYWSDDHIQRSLDKTRRDLYQVELEQWPTLGTAGTYTYTEYRAPIGNLESGTAVFLLQQTNGGTAPANTPDYETGIITFAADTGGLDYMLTARTYDINAAAADVWRGKAANSANYFDFKTDNHDIKKSQFHTHCLEMAAFFTGQSVTQSFSVTTINRSDVVPAWGDE
jgi:hypothetical protein